ncbi:MAG: ABC transporter ATP-binding protein [Chloroflexota bacterium]|nr:ABC transporter ATP-binding protein [Chloroflexota bacterium]
MFRRHKMTPETEPVVDGVMVEARDINKSYRTEEVVVQALRGVSLSIERGEMVAVMGPSGCGKTTLLNTVSGLDSIDSGEIFISGQPLHKVSDSRRTAYRARRMGFIFQSYNLLPVLSAVENVELPLLVSGVGADTARRRALEALGQVGLKDRARHRPNQLSGGQQQRVAIARALVNQPAIIWADEPTGNLDSDASREVLDLMRRLNRENKQTFVIVTHDPGVGALADRIVQMKDGRIVSHAEQPEPVAAGVGALQ